MSNKINYDIWIPDEWNPTMTLREITNVEWSEITNAYIKTYRVQRLWMTNDGKQQEWRYLPQINAKEAQ